MRIFLSIVCILCGTWVAWGDYIDGSGDDSQFVLESATSDLTGPVEIGTSIADDETPTVGQMMREELEWLRDGVLLLGAFLGAYLVSAALRQIKP